MKYLAIEFTSGRAGDGYMEVDAITEELQRLTDADGVTIEPAPFEYHITDVNPPHQAWMQGA